LPKQSFTSRKVRRHRCPKNPQRLNYGLIRFDEPLEQKFASFIAHSFSICPKLFGVEQTQEIEEINVAEMNRSGSQEQNAICILANGPPHLV
jgi:hypothetical protein